MVIPESNMFFLQKCRICQSFCMDVPPAQVLEENNLISETQLYHSLMCDLGSQFVMSKLGLYQNLLVP